MLLQITANSMCLAGCYFMIGICFLLIYRTAKFYDFSIPIVMTFGPYVCYALKENYQLSFAALIPIAMVLSGCISWIIALGIYGIARKKAASQLVLLLSSIGVYTVIQNLISLAFGDQPLAIRSIRHTYVLSFAEIIISLPQFVTLVGAFLVGSVFHFIATCSKAGKAWRAVACDSDLAFSSGVNVDRVTYGSAIVAGTMAGGVGILFAYDFDMVPTMGLNPFLMGVIAVTVGGIKRITSIAIGSLLLGAVQSYSVWIIDSNWQTSISFSILLLVLLLQPQGVFSKDRNVNI